MSSENLLKNLCKLEIKLNDKFTNFLLKFINLNIPKNIEIPHLYYKQCEFKITMLLDETLI
jgi:hypothetical protein